LPEPNEGKDVGWNEWLGVNAPRRWRTALTILGNAHEGRNSIPYFAAMAFASFDPLRVGLPVSSIVTSAIIASKIPPGELMII
jgi:hypothetical protein